MSKMLENTKKRSKSQMGQQDVLTLLKENRREFTSKEIALHLGVGYTSVSTITRKLIQQGLVKVKIKQGGTGRKFKYSLK